MVYLFFLFKEMVISDESVAIIKKRLVTSHVTDDVAVSGHSSMMTFSLFLWFSGGLQTNVQGAC